MHPLVGLRGSQLGEQVISHCDLGGYGTPPGPHRDSLWMVRLPRRPSTSSLLSCWPYCWILPHSNSLPASASVFFLLDPRYALPNTPTCGRQTGVLGYTSAFPLPSSSLHWWKGTFHMWLT